VLFIGDRDPPYQPKAGALGNSSIMGNSSQSLEEPLFDALLDLPRIRPESSQSISAQQLQPAALRRDGYR